MAKRKTTKVTIEVKARTAKTYEAVEFEIQCETARQRAISAITAVKNSNSSKSAIAKRARRILREKLQNYQYLGAYYRHQPRSA